MKRFGFLALVLLSASQGLEFQAKGERSSSARPTTTTARSPSATSATSGRPTGRRQEHPAGLTVHKGRDIYPKFSPDGQSIAFSSDREGNLDIYVIPATGGTASAGTTQHTADDVVMDWAPDGKSLLFTSQRGEGFMGKLYTISLDGTKTRDAGPDMGIYGVYSPDGSKLVINRKGQSYWRKYYRGAYQTDVTVMDIASKTFKDLTTFDGLDSWPMWSKDGFVYFVSDRDGKGLTNIWRVSEKALAPLRAVTEFHGRRCAAPRHQRWTAQATIVFEHDFGIWKARRSCLRREGPASSTSSTSTPRAQEEPH